MLPTKMTTLAGLGEGGGTFVLFSRKPFLVYFYFIHITANCIHIH